MPRAEIIGTTLRDLRGDRTQQEIADAVGVSQAAIGQYERGVRIPRDDIKTRLAAYFGVDLSIFFPQNVNETFIQGADETNIL